MIKSCLTLTFQNMEVLRVVSPLVLSEPIADGFRSDGWDTSRVSFSRPERPIPTALPHLLPLALPDLHLHKLEVEEARNFHGRASRSTSSLPHLGPISAINYDDPLPNNLNNLNIFLLFPTLP